MKVHIHPHYAAYESYIRAIPSEEYEREEVIVTEGTQSKECGSETRTS